MSVALKPTASNLTDAEMEALIVAARGGGSDRRVDPRHAFFTAVTLWPADAPTTPVSAFSREVSCAGIGLLHSVPLGSGERFEIDILIGDVRVRKTGRVVWCREVGDGWYLSGCKFV
jgi:hypothetical protein